MALDMFYINTHHLIKVHELAMVVTLTLQCFKITYSLHEKQADFQK